MNAKETVESYLREMLEWETSFYKLMRTPQYRSNENNCRTDGLSNAKKTLARIIEKYLSSGAAETLGKAALDTMAVGNPPRYAQELEEANEKEKSANVIYRSANGALLMPFCRYSLSLIDGAWRIKELHSSVDKIKWTKNKGL